jgi:hypothetical protein
MDRFRDRKVGGVMKKITSTLLVMLAMPALSGAQSASGNQGPSDISIVKVSWKVRAHRQELPDKGATSAETNSGSDQAQAVRGGDTRTRSGNLGGYGPVFKNEADSSDAVITLTNVGAKAIKRISYTFLFIDATNSRTLLSYKFKDKVAIEPGETKTFWHPVGYAPVHQFARGVVAPGFVLGGTVAPQAVDNRLQITRVEYVDGSVWKGH